MSKLPSPHGDKLIALLENGKLPKGDIEKLKEAIQKYKEWVASFEQIHGNSSSKIEQCVKSLNAYKNFIEIDLIFCSKDDFLYRQKGQLKLDNTVLEEFLPLFVNCIFKDIIKEKHLLIGPITCISGIRFDSSLINEKPGGGIELRQKDQDFAISKKLFIKASHYENFDSSSIRETNIAYLACECKTNLDKTMFQEASATALDLKSTVPSAKYLLLCEWLDMTPISTSTTAIDEIIILRKAKRLGSQDRKDFSTYQDRQAKLEQYRDFIKSHPYAVDTFTRFVEHIESLIIDAEEGAILSRGYF
jgi:hypothetical protein